MSDAPPHLESTSTAALPLYEARHQEDNAHVPWVLGTVGLLFALLLVCFLFAWGLLAGFSRPGGMQPVRPDPAAMGHATAWLHPGEALRQTRAAAEHRLSTYGWVDKSGGVVHIPIERAMQLEAQRAHAKDGAP